MTRIIAGNAGGRIIETPRGARTRPTTDRVREALFSRVESVLDLSDTRVLDLYAGSGALGLEAASRGARSVWCIERDPRTAAMIARNAKHLGVDVVQVSADRVERALATGGDTAYNLVLADPPYSMSEQDVSATLDALIAQGWVADEAMVMLERSSRGPEPTWPTGLRGVRTRTYGQTALHEAIAVLEEA
ncbi:MAG: 16S rRNA (guanine(966)-N(2))-methyltransferase RsmD [Ornithinimicrobium sp.]